eukprot:SAG31_NODE_438_length_15693_cov_6.254248_8_plen_75_part_00
MVYDDRLEWHRSSVYHYFVLTAVQAYLCVSGAYRMMPPTASMGEVCGLKLQPETRSQAVFLAAVRRSPHFCSSR